MYPIRYKIIAIVFLVILCLFLSLFNFSGILPKGSGQFFIYKLTSSVSILCPAAIILSSLIMGANGPWLIFLVSALGIFIISMLTGNYFFNIQILILLGVSVPVVKFCKKRILLFEKNKSTTEKVKETTNIIKSEYLKIKGFNNALVDRLKRYNNLIHIGEAFGARLSPEQIYQLAVETVYQAVPDADAVLLFVVDEARQRLELCASKTRSQLPRIKAKNGDIFDSWVFKERQPLNVSDVYEDFRFDYKPVEKERHFASLISAPLMSQSRIMGVLRVNSAQRNAYTFDDLRMLDFISDIIAGAVNNARLYKTAEELATTDSLTGFYVHQYFKQRLAEEIDRARITGAMFSVIMIDIDHFKDYNDKYGHSAGDKVLVDIAVMLRKFTGEGSFMARYGGEELAIILPNMDMQGALAIAEEIREHIFLHRFLLRRKETRVTVSAGVISYSADIKGRDDLLQKVDFYLYKAKKEGRNKICAA